MIRVGNGNARYLAEHFERVVIPSVRAFRQGVLRYVLPGFEQIEKDAEQLATNTCNNTAWSEHVDPAAVAELAHEQGQEFSEMMFSVRQTMLNLVTAGLYHHVEQQLAHIRIDRLFIDEPPLKDTKLEIVKKWYQIQFDLPLEEMNSWDVIEELRWLTNTVKHTEIKDTEKLWEKREELFHPPGVDRFPELQDCTRAISQPLAGEDLFVRTEHFEMYADAAESFFTGIAKFFRTTKH